MSQPTHTLFDLLPALYRIKDAQVAASQGLRDPKTGEVEPGPLQSLLTLVEEQFAVVSEDLAQFYDDQFIETCASWVIPYIGDLIGYKPVHGVATAIASPRAEVANTISFRRRKGTILVLEQLARDVTGWGAHAEEMFKLVAATQYMKRPGSGESLLPRYAAVGRCRDYMDRRFDATAHTIDVRRIQRVRAGRGRYNIHNIAIFLWSLNAYSLSNAPLTPVAGSAQFFRFSSLGADMPLFNNPVSQGSQIASPAQPVNVPDRLTRRLSAATSSSCRRRILRARANSLALYLSAASSKMPSMCRCAISPAMTEAGSTCRRRAVRSLPPSIPNSAASPWPLRSRPACRRRRPTRASTATWAEASTLRGPTVLRWRRAASFFSFSHAAGTTLQSMLDSAVNQIAAIPGTTHVAVEITDSSTYATTSATSSALEIYVPAGATVELRAADGCRPTLLLSGEFTVTGGLGSTFMLNGLVLAYSPPGVTAPAPAGLVHVPATAANQLGSLAVNHCTLVPGFALSSDGSSLLALIPPCWWNSGCRDCVQKSIVGALQVQRQCVRASSVRQHR